jgi:hypothetical protein
VITPCRDPAIARGNVALRLARQKQQKPRHLAPPGKRAATPQKD